MQVFKEFKDDPASNVDDQLALIAAKMAARNDLISTLTGAFIAIFGTIAPIIICYASVPMEVKVAAWGGGGLANLAGAAISKQNPFMVRSEVGSRKSEVKKEIEIN